MSLIANKICSHVAKDDLVDISLFLHGGFNIASISEITETWLRIAQMSHRIEVDGDSHEIIIKHTTWDQSN